MAQTEQLLSEFKSGNIGTFYNELYAKLLVYASRHLGPDYAFLAEDCVQDAVYKAYEQRGNRSSRSKLFCIPASIMQRLIFCGKTRRNPITSRNRMTVPNF